MKKFLDFCKGLPKHASNPWYPYVLGLIAFADYFLFVIPLDAMVVASVVAARRRWFSITMWASFGSTLGAGVFAILIQRFGLIFLQRWAPHLLEDQLAQTITHWLQHYGFWALIGIAMMPIHQHPTVAIAALANISILTIIITMFIGRQLKYCIYTWVATHAKNGLSSLWKKR